MARTIASFVHRAPGERSHGRPGARERPCPGGRVLLAHSDHAERRYRDRSARLCLCSAPYHEPGKTAPASGEHQGRILPALDTRFASRAVLRRGYRQFASESLKELLRASVFRREQGLKKGIGCAEMQLIGEICAAVSRVGLEVLQIAERFRGWNESELEPLLIEVSPWPPPIVPSAWSSGLRPSACAARRWPVRSPQARS